jgi:hypothetical protein
MNSYIIYKAENTFTNEVYVGATKKTLDKRRNDHLLKSMNGSNVCFHKAINTFSSEAFVWSVIDTANSTNELAKKEIEYIYLYDSLKNGYNSDKGGGIKKTVYQFNIETGNLISSYDDLSSAANAVNANNKSISNACLHYSKTCKGYVWSYSSTLEFTFTLDERKKAVSQSSLTGDFIISYESASEASRKTGLSKSCITRCCRSERKQSGGFLWEYI